MGYYNIGSGQTSNNIVLNGSDMYISSGGVANSTTVNQYGWMYISNGGVANRTTVNSTGEMIISSGGVANRTTVNSWGDMHIEDGGVANSTTVNPYGHMYISSGGVANSTIVNSDGYMYLRSGGVANRTTVNSTGEMIISSGGVATDITAKSGAVLKIYVASDTYIQGTYNGSAFEMKDAYISGYTVNQYGNMCIASGGVANDTTVNSDGRMYISSGGVANSTNINGGYMFISSGGVANSTTVNTQGGMFIPSGGVANSTTVNSWSTMSISSGGVANSTTVNDRGCMYIYSGGSATALTLSAGGMLGRFSFAEDKYWENITDGSAFIADNVYIIDNRMYISNGGVANSTTVNGGGSMFISSGGVANSTTVNTYGYMFIFSGGSATEIVEDGGYVNVAKGANVTFASNTISGLTFSDRSMTVHSNTVANNTTVNTNGGMYIHSGGVANSTTVNSDGSMFISSGGVHRGSLNVKIGAVVSAYEGGVIDFTVADRTVKDGYLINDLSLITGTPIYTVTVDDNQAYGTYKLAQGAENFTGSVTIGNGEVEYGSVTVNGEVFSYGGAAYTLMEKGGNLNLVISNDKYIFISSKFNEKTTGKKQDDVLLEYGRNAFTSIDDVDYSGNKTIVLLDSKNSGDYSDRGTVAGVVVVPVVKETDNSYSYKATETPKGTLNISQDTGSTEFIRFATVNVTGATVGNIAGGKESSTEDTKSAVDKKGNTTETDNTTYSQSATGKFTAINGSAGVVENYATVTLTGAEVATLSGGNTQETSNSKLVDGETKDQKTISTVNDSVAAGSVTLKNQAKADTISGYSNVTLTDSTAGNITNFTSKDSKSDTATYDEAENTVTRKVTLSHTETTAGTLKATNSTLGDVTGFATVTLKDVDKAGDFRRVDSDGNKYSTIKEILTVKTNKDGYVTGTYNKTETFTRAGKFTATGSTVGNIENFSNVTLDGSDAEAISNFVEAKAVTTGTAEWDNAEAYGRPDDYAIDLQGWNMEEPVETKSLNGSVTLKNGASATSITDFKSVTMTGSEVGEITNVEKVTVNKGDSTIDNYIGTDGNDTLTIAKGAVLTADKLDLGEGAKDTLAINGTLILTGTEVVADKFSGKGEIAVVDSLFDELDLDFANILNVGATASNFRGTAYESADNTAKKAVKWDGKAEYNGWLGSWEGYKTGSDTVDYIKFTAQANDELIVDGVEDWTLLDKKGNNIGKEITAAGEYTIKLKHEENNSIDYTIKLA